MTRAVDHFQEAVNLARENDTSVDLAFCLARLHRRDPKELQRFIQTKSVSRRKTYLLLEIGTHLTGLRISPNPLKKIGWTKLQVVARHLTAENKSELLKLAQDNTAHELKKLLLAENAEPDTNCVLLYFTEDQYQDFERAVLQHGGKRSGRGLIKMEEALIEIIRQSQKKPKPKLRKGGAGTG